MAKGESGHLRLGFGFTPSSSFPEQLSGFAIRSLMWKCRFGDMSTSEQVDGLLGEKLDLGFIRLTAVKRLAAAVKRLSTLSLLTDRMMLVTSSSQKFPGTIKLSELRDQPFVLISHQRSPTFHSHLLELCAEHGFIPRVVQEVPEITTVLALVRAGLGISMIPASFSNNRFEGIRTHEIPDRAAEWTVAAAWRKGDPNPLIPRFLDLLRDDQSEEV